MTVHLDVWTVGTSAIGKALWHMAADPLLLRRVPGLEFHKSLGTGAGRRFTAADADLRRWALVTCWSAEPSEVPVLDKWHRLARSHTDSLSAPSPVTANGPGAIRSCQIPR